jgi:hypothetical protein
MLVWDNSGVPSLSSYDALGGGAADCSGGIKDIGGGWYRAFVPIPLGLDLTGTEAPKLIDVLVSPTIKDTYWSNKERNEIRGSIYVARPQLEWGQTPTKYKENDTSSGVLDDNMRYTLFNTTDWISQVNPTIYFVSSLNGLSFSGIYEGEDATDPYGFSAIIPPATKPLDPPTPNDRYLTSQDVKTSAEERLGWNISEGKFCVGAGAIHGAPLSAIDDSWTFVTGVLPINIGNITYYIGTPEQVARIKVVSSLTTEGVDNAGVDGVQNNTQFAVGANNSTADLFGYYPLLLNGDNNLSFNNRAWVNNSDSTFSSTGEVLYGFGSGRSTDPIVSWFGGVSIIGLYGLDLKAIKENDPTAYPPYNGGGECANFNNATENFAPTRRYKLMAKKVLLDNIFRRDGSPTEGGVLCNPPLANSEDLRIEWRLKFL